MKSSQQIEALLNRAVFDGVFPGAICAWGDPLLSPTIACAGRSEENGEAVDIDLMYDLASLSKILCTTSIYMRLSGQGLNLHTCLADLGCFKSVPPPWDKINLEQLLRHQSGLPPWRPLYLLKVYGPYEKKQKISETIFAQYPEAMPSERTIYSDLGFILLGFIAEHLTGWTLDEAFTQLITNPLNITRLGFRPADGRIAPTERGPRTPGPLNYTGLPIFGDVPLRRVHDDNAAFLDGIAGHAGLFGSIKSLWSLASHWALSLKYDKSPIFKGAIIKEFIKSSPTQKDDGRPIGFDKKSKSGSLESTNFSGKTVGHLGYTGCNLWWDIEKSFLWILLSNRVCPSAENLKINDFRRKLASILL